MKHFFDEAGNAWTVPLDRETAKQERYRFYLAEDACPECENRGFLGAISRKRYTATGTCVHCADIDAMDLRALAAYITSFDHDEKGVIYKECKPGGKSRRVSMEYADRMDALLALVPGSFPLTRQQAIDAGQPLFLSGKACRTHGHLGVTTVQGKCYHCEKRRARPSPRQAAVASGARWYTPADPCKRCDTLAERRVADGACRGCMDASKGEDGRETPESVMMKACPELVISRAEAKAAGLKVYRTGQACRRGHTAYRYVSTGGCLECLRA